MIVQFNGCKKKNGRLQKFHFSNNNFYNKKIGDALPDNWNDIPKITKSDLQGDMDDILTKTIEKNDIYISNTSGSSGHPFYFAKDKMLIQELGAYWAIRYSEIGLSLKSKEAKVLWNTKRVKKFLIEKLKDLLLNRVRFPVFDLSDDILENF